jgi:ATP synthase protein I
VHQLVAATVAKQLKSIGLLDRLLGSGQGGSRGMKPPPTTKPIRHVLKWQAAATAAIAVIGGMWAGVHGALSAVLGGVVNMSACVVFAVVVAVSRPATPGGTVMTLFRAEAAKILVIVVQLWLVLTGYRDVVLAAFFAAFVVTVLLFRMALIVRD